MPLLALLSRDGGQCHREGTTASGEGPRGPKSQGTPDPREALGPRVQDGVPRADLARPSGGADPRYLKGQRTSGGGARSRGSGAASREVSSFESLGGGAGASGTRLVEGGAEQSEWRHGGGGAAAGERLRERPGCGCGPRGAGEASGGVPSLALRPFPAPAPCPPTPLQGLSEHWG